MKRKYITQVLAMLLYMATIGLVGCLARKTPANSDEAETRGYRSLAPERVDIRGTIVQRRYSEGQVVLEVEGFGTTSYSRFDRAFVLVLPTIQMLDPDGQPVSLNELQLGDHVAIMLRGSGHGNFVGVGVARKLWLEEIL